MDNVKIVEVNEKNIDDFPPRCFLKTDNIGYKKKYEWLLKRFSEGLQIKNMYSSDDKYIGYIEYIKGENTWRAVNAKDYLFIHCIWIYPNKNKNKGYGSKLVKEVINDSKKQGKNGVAVVTSEGAFMAGKALFEENGFKVAEESKPFSLMVKKFNNGVNPSFRDWNSQLEKYKGLNIIYSNQCPWVARSIPEIKEVAKKEGLKFNFFELKTSEEAQNAPSIYASFNLISDGKLIADHFISTRRFQNILKKELKK